MPEMTYTATVYNHLIKLRDALDKLNPDTKHNAGRLIGRAFFWDQIAKFAKKQSEVAWDELENEEIVSYVESPGDHTLAESPHFMVMDKVSEPRRAFNADVLAEDLKKKYKVPVPISKELIEKAKIPGKSVHTSTIVER